MDNKKFSEDDLKALDDMIDKLESDNDLIDMFSGIVPENEYYANDDNVTLGFVCSTCNSEFDYLVGKLKLCSNKKNIGFDNAPKCPKCGNEKEMKLSEESNNKIVGMIITGSLV